MSYDVLDGVRVVELSMYAFAPSSAAVLADWGADVIKVVPPGSRRSDDGHAGRRPAADATSASRSCGRS